MSKESTEPASGRKVLKRYLLIAGIATVLLVTLKMVVEHTSWGHESELWVFGKLQGSLSPIDLDNPVVVLDIAQLPGGRVGQPTSREKLKEIITALAELQPSPRAIAVDVNFSPKGPEYSAKEDEEFFDFCLAVTKKQKVPVFLAVAETKSGPPEAWLGSEDFKDLAVAAAGDKNDTSRLPLWVKSPYSSEKLKTLNYALALEYRKRLPGPNHWIEPFVETHVEVANEGLQEQVKIEDEATLTYEDRFVNYSKLDQMKLAAHPDVDAQAVKRAAAKYSNKLVILGDLEVDKIPVPDRVIDESGSLVLASATYTLIKEPLFEFKWWVRVVLDVLIAGLIIAAVALFRRKSSAGWSGKQALCVYAAMILVGIAGWKLVSWAGVLWLDFLLVALAAFLHPKTEHLVDRIVTKFDPKGAEPSAPPEAGATVEPVTKPPAEPIATTKTVAAIVVCVLAMSIESLAQQGSSPRCEQKVAAIGLRLSVPKQKSKQKNTATCYLRENKESPWQALTEDSAKRQYRARQHLYCDDQCSLTILYCGTQTEQVVNTRRPDWFPLLHAFRSPPVNDPRKDNLLRVASSFSPPDPKTSSHEDTRRRFSGRLFGDLAGISARSIDSAKLAKKTPPTAPATPTKETPTQRSPAGRTSGGMAAGRSDTSAAPSAGTSGETAFTKEAKFEELLRKANLARQQGNYVLARDSYFEAQKLQPTDYRVFQGLGNLYADQKDWRAAEQTYLLAVEWSSFSSTLSLSLAFVKLKAMIASGEHSRAKEVEELLQVASALSPSDRAIYDLYQQLFEFENTDPAKMEPVLRRAVSYMPHSVTANLRLAHVLQRLSQRDEALKYVRQAEQQATSSNLLLVARAYESNRRYDDAERVLKQALESMPSDPTVLYSLGSLMVQRKRFGKALKFLQKAVELQPVEFAPVLVFGIAQLGKGNLADAERSLDQASGRVNDDADGRQRLAYWFSSLGDAYDSKGKLADAIRAYEKSLKYDAENSDTQRRLSEVQRKHDSKDR